MFKYIEHFNDSQFQYSDVNVAHREVQYYSFGLNDDERGFSSCSSSWSISHMCLWIKRNKKGFIEIDVHNSPQTVS